MRTLLVTLALVLVSSIVAACTIDPVVDKPTSRPAGEATFDHQHVGWSAVLKKHVKGDRFDYAALKKDPVALDKYLVKLGAVTAKELKGWNEDERMAFWINAYNANVVKLVADNYPLESIRDIGSVFSKVWNKEFIRMKALHPSGKEKKLSLDDIEHKILRPRFKDARVHAAVNCASDSCPALRAEAFVAKRLDAQLDEQVRAWLADESRNKFDVAGSKLQISSLFDWFEDDFVRDGKSVSGWIAKYARKDVAAAITAGKKFKISYLDYSWKLNE